MEYNKGDLIMEEIKVNLDNLTNEERETLLKLVEKGNKINKKHWRGEKNDTYYSISNRGILLKDNESGYPVDDCSYQFGNYFKTAKEADFARQKHLIYLQLKDYALEHNTEEIDWENYSLSKFCIAYDYHDSDLFIDDMQTVKYPNTVYFTSEKIAENAINEIGEDNIKKYLFGVN